MDYINTKDTKVLFENTDYAHVLSYLLNEKIKYNELGESELINKYDKGILEKIDNAINELQSSCRISIDILAKNLGIHPFLQQNLLEYFNSKKDNDFSDLIPCRPYDEHAYTNYIQAISRISKQLTGEPKELSKYIALLVRNWMRGYGLARIISENIEYWGKQKKTAVIIRDAMKDIEEYARFKFLKYISCYNSILAQCFLRNGKNELIGQIPNMNLWLEFGASQLTQISLMGLGLSRNTALQITEKHISREDMTVAECIEWLSDAPIKSFELNAISIREIEKILVRYDVKLN